MAWQNPLRALPLIPQHPASLTSGLSSALTDPELFHESLLEVYNVLDNFGKRDKSNKAASILGAFLERLPKDGKSTLMTEIQSFSRHEQKLRDLAQHLVDAILKPFKLAGGNSPTSAVTPSPAEDADEIEEAMQYIESSTRQGQRALKMDCLKRDGFKCIYSGAYDRASAINSLVNAPRGHPVSPTECAYIIPFALGKFDDSKAVETRNKATIWSAIYRYFPALEGKIHAGNINQSANAITLLPAAHKLFGDYDLTFWPQSQDGWYEVRLAGDYPFIVPPKSGTSIIQLDQEDPSIPLPDKEFFKVHHRIAQILEVSGVGRETDDEMEKAEEAPENMDPNGSTDVGLLISQRMLMRVGR